MSKISTIGVLTSGGDSPGMNAAIRAVVRTCVYEDVVCKGIRHGYAGLIEGDVQTLDVRSVSAILGRGGTALKSSRSEDFRTQAGRARAFETLKSEQIDALVVIGGDGSFTGAIKLGEEYDVPIIGIPGTIDNDLFGTDYTIGFDTATNTVVDSVDKIRDTATSHDRLFFVEVMGRDSGFIALKAGVATGAIAILLPEEEVSINELIHILKRGAKSKKKSNIVIVAEGDTNGGAMNVANEVNKHTKEFETRVTILGHIQRGGAPTYFDRVLASRMGVAAVEGLLEGRRAEMVGVINDLEVFSPLTEVINKRVIPNVRDFSISKILSI